MKKVISPVKCEVYTRSGKTQMVRAFCKIEFENGKLSIHGVVGPMSNGDCRGSAGQCSDSIRSGDPIVKEGWTAEMVQKLCDIWDRWHLNDMRAACEHQRALGWEKEAKEKITLRHYKLCKDAAIKAKEAEAEAIKHLKAGETFTPTFGQSYFASLPYFIDTYDELPPIQAQFYEPNTLGIHGASEEKMRGWVRFNETPNGILCKPCPVCGYKYGTAWLKEEVPQDVIEWLESLPDSPERPAWI